MLSLANSMFLVVFIIELVLGFCCNSFIGLLSFINWVKSKRMTLFDFIITSLSLSRLCLLWVIIFDILKLIYPNFSEAMTTDEIIDIIWLFINHLSIWLTTCLSVYYCLKIANFSHSVFLWLKWRVSYVVIWILLGSVFFSFFSISSPIKDLSVSFSSTQITLITNCTENTIKKRSYSLRLIFSALWMVIPLVVIICSSLLLILSLRRHIQQMKNNITGSRDSSTEAHLRATRTILSSLFLFTVYFVAFFILMLSDLLPDDNLALMTGEMITAAYPSIHSFILILGNNKLKLTFLRMLTIMPERTR
ncbi:taste receptor type 2 member 3-like [Dromiciops gliroides]|uniref:taste receptor type 2 member 3-like n=1 Tax=Dromiciops gliroides TaxID=33562 RepID=UPI001CC44284|nr:taste receptor type 2 member 3-like [Dromiciops gliroides]